MKSFKSFGGKAAAFPDFGAGGHIIPQLTEEQQLDLARILNSERLARECLKLMAANGRMSLPEAIVMVYLDRWRYPYLYQESVFGGRNFKGGTVMDFLVDVGGAWVAILVQGNFWHTLEGVRQRDLATKLQVVGQELHGLMVYSAVELWELPLIDYTRRERVIRDGTQGKDSEQI